MLGGSNQLNCGDNDVGEMAYHILLLRRLDTLTNEESLYEALQRLGPIVRVMLVRDRVTHTSQGFAFVEYPSVLVATDVLTAVNGQYEIDSKEVIVCYASISIDSSQPYWDQQAYFSHFVAPDESSTSADDSSSAETTAQTQMSQNATLAALSTLPTRPAVQKQQVDPVNEEDELASFYADVGATILKESDENSSIFRPPSPVPEGQQEEESKEPAPSPYLEEAGPNFVLEENGMYYNRRAGLHYDPNTKYFYNTGSNDTCPYVREPETGAYKKLVDPNEAKLKAEQLLQAFTKKQEAKREEEEKKEVEKTEETEETEKKREESEEKPKMERKEMEAEVDSNPQKSEVLKALLTYDEDDIAPVEKESESLPKIPDDIPEQEWCFVDLARTACLLCNRKFKSVDVLRKHFLGSKLHKEKFQEHLLKSKQATE
eukprot:Lithocolla_globosa_v1_NODE_2121_length_2156_cov_5.731080.p1 type:complete len:431 gc:universal NODE_2121_length_2156_cov_5.731080:1337-45(-)